MSKLAIVALLFVLGAAISLTEAQDIPSCATQLVPCANYLNATTKPPNTCCDPIKQAVATQLDCLCNLYKDPNLLKSFGINVTDAVRMTRLCGVTADLTACNKASADSPAASVPPPPGQAGSDGGSAADRVAWTGITSLVLFLTPAMLY